MADTKSIRSDTISVDLPVGNIFEDSEDFEIQERIESFQHEIVQLTKENKLLETNLDRKKLEKVIARQVSDIDQSIHVSQITTPNGANQEVTTSRNDRVQRKRSKSRSTQADFRLQLTFQQKLDIATAEYEFTRNEKVNSDLTYEKQIDQLESDLEWIENEIEDFNLSIADFYKVKDSSIDKRTKTLIGEKLIHYFNERLKAREALMNKLRDRSSGFKRQITRIENQLRQKEEMGDTLQEVDFSQLKIENKQYLDKIDEKNLELVILKRQAAKFTQVLNRYKDDLHNKTQDLLSIEKRLDKQTTLGDHTQRETLTASFEQKRAARKNLNLTEQIENYRVPEILDYVRKKALLTNLKRDCEVWQRKVELVSMGFQQVKQKWYQVQRSARDTYENFN